MPVLAKFRAVQTALAAARTVDEVKDIRDKAEALRLYAKQAGESLEMQNAVAEIKLRAERRAGELLAEMEKNKGAAATTRSQRGTALKDLGITKNQSSRWQAESRVPEEEFEQFVSDTNKQGKELTSAGLRRLAARQTVRVSTEPETIRLPDGGQCIDNLDDIAGQTFGTIYADPPWKYGNQGTRAATSNHYETMTVDEIAAMPIAELAAEKSHLHLWTTNAFLFDAKKIIEAWGFEYKSCFIWVKPQMGIGNYWRISHEFMLLGVRGSLTFRSKSEKSWMELRREGHSIKPYPIREAIERASPGPRLELFGRKQVADWMVFGNQIETRLFA